MTNAHSEPIPVDEYISCWCPAEAGTALLMLHGSPCRLVRAPDELQAENAPYCDTPLQ